LGAAQTSLTLAQFIDGDLIAKQAHFNTEIAPDLIRQLLIALGR
jgi:hypothetical protein